MYIYIYIYTCIYIHTHTEYTIVMSMLYYMYVHIHKHTNTRALLWHRDMSGWLGSGSRHKFQQLRFIHRNQLFRIQYTCFELDTVNIDWGICINVCLVKFRRAKGSS